MQNLLSGRLESIFTLLSPLSHIGSSIGPDSYLATQSILGADGNPTEVFVYSGNALRGMWRDAGAKYMLDKLGAGATLQIPLELFHLFFSGGSIGGDQAIDIDQARRIRQAVPHLSVFGGGVGNMILPGKISVGEGLPVCRELAHIIPDSCPGNRELSWRQMTTEVSYTRKDDAKDELLRPYIQDLSAPALNASKQTQMALLTDSETTDAAPKGKGKKDKEGNTEDDRRPQQMRYTLEVFCRGAVLWQETVFQGLTEIELGALVAAIAEWSKQPYLGGQARIGMGKVKVDMSWELVGKEKERFLSISDGKCLLSQPAGEAKEKYDKFLEKYAGYLEEKRDGLIKAISGKVANA
ncbi:MAG TPA: hypothetical protein GXX51_00600 [Firmicutes bacterium]|nr:hypothetical protein [Bacillota bacterium]